MTIILSERQLQWINALGGRNTSHVKENQNGKYFIFLSLTEGGSGKYIIPDDKDITLPIDTLEKIY